MTPTPPRARRSLVLRVLLVLAGLIAVVLLLVAWSLRGYLGWAIYQPDLAYGRNGGVELHLDLARPRFGSGPFPAVVAIHGGGWKFGDKSDFGPLIRYLAARGYVAVSVQYRFTPDHVFPAQLEDVKCAVRWVRSHADELDVDPDRIGAIGGSAGAHLALLLGVLSPADGLEGSGCNDGPASHVHAVVNFFGPTDLSRPVSEAVQPLLDDLLGGPQAERLDAARRGSPVTYLDAGDAPILTFHGTADSVVPYEHATILQRAAQESGVEAQLVSMEGQGHGWGGLALLDSVGRTVDFLDAQLMGSD